MENDEEIDHFHPRDISYIATILKASTHGADISILNQKSSKNKNMKSQNRIWNSINRL